VATKGEQRIQGEDSELKKEYLRVLNDLIASADIIDAAPDNDETLMFTEGAIGFIERILKEQRAQYFVNKIKTIKGGVVFGEDEHGNIVPQYPGAEKFTKIIESIKEEVLKPRQKRIIENLSPNVFICHASAEEKYSNPLADMILRFGIKDVVCTSHVLRAIRPGVDIESYLYENITENTLMIILWSNASMDSDHCTKEKKWALEEGAYTISILLPNFDSDHPEYKKWKEYKGKEMAINLESGTLASGIFEIRERIEGLFKMKIGNRDFDFHKKVFEEKIKTLITR